MVSTVTPQITGTPAVPVTAQQLNGASAGLGQKAPCRVATTANITLSGLQTIDGIAVAADDRVLVKNQTVGSANGIYVASTGVWQRASDFSGLRDATFGTMVFAASGTAGAHVYYVSTAAGFIIGTTSLSFTIAFPLVTVSASAPSGGSNGDLWARI